MVAHCSSNGLGKPGTFFDLLFQKELLFKSVVEDDLVAI